MPKVKVFDLLKEVEYNRKSLIKHCNENGINISPNASLSTVVGVNNTINKDRSLIKKKVIWIDIDGSTLYETEVDYGSSVSHPDIIPNYDPMCLEFEQWHTNADLNNIVEDTVVGPLYQTIADEEGRRWTYMFMDLTDATKLTMDLAITCSSPFYIDWGDGSGILEYNNVNNTNKKHTYSNTGSYIVKFWSSGSISTINNNHIITGSNTSYAFKKFYIGSNFTKMDVRFCEGASELLIFSCPTTFKIDSLYGYTGTSASYFGGSNKLKALILYNGDIYHSFFKNCYNLQYCILPYATKSIGTHAFYNCYNLKYLTLPKTVRKIYEGAFYNCYNLQHLDCSYITDIENNAFYNTYNLETFLFPLTPFSYGSSLFQNSTITDLVLRDSLVSLSSSIFAGAYKIKNVILYPDFDFSFTLNTYKLTDDNLFQIALWLKDNNDSTAKTFTFSAYGTKNRLQNLFIDKITGLQTTEDNENAISLLEYMQNKNWTITAN